MPIIGHQKIAQFFDNAINSGNLSQSYCFVGCEQLGKRALARNIAARLLKVNEKQLDTHPDFFYLSRGEDEKTGKLKKDISIAQARRLKERIAGKSWLGGHKVAVIDEAELLNKESANALLKVLEEAGANTVFFLLVTNDDILLPTIRSRCQLFYLSLVPDEEMAKGLREAGYSEETAKEAIALAWGRPGRAKMLAEDFGLRQEYTSEIERWGKIVGEPFYGRLKQAADLLKDNKEEGGDKERLSKLLEVWIMLWREAMLHKIFAVQRPERSSKNQLAEKSMAAVQEIAAFIDSFKRTQAMLRQNVNVKLLVEELLLRAG